MAVWRPRPVFFIMYQLLLGVPAFGRTDSASTTLTLQSAFCVFGKMHINILNPISQGSKQCTGNTETLNKDAKHASKHRQPQCFFAKGKIKF